MFAIAFDMSVAHLKEHFVMEKLGATDTMPHETEKMAEK